MYNSLDKEKFNILNKFLHVCVNHWYATLRSNRPKISPSKFRDNGDVEREVKYIESKLTLMTAKLEIRLQLNSLCLSCCWNRVLLWSPNLNNNPDKISFPSSSCAILLGSSQVPSSLDGANKCHFVRLQVVLVVFDWLSFIGIKL